MSMRIWQKLIFQISSENRSWIQNILGNVGTPDIDFNGHCTVLRSETVSLKSNHFLSAVIFTL